MPWVRFDDQYPIHRKVAGLSDAAFRLHSAAIFWCARNGTDGFVPREDLDQVCAQVRDPARFAAECVRRGTWHNAAHACASENCPAPREGDGWVIHDYLEYQPTKEEAEAAEKKQREQKSSGGKLGNHRRWHTARGVKDPDCPWCSPPDPSVSDRYPIGGSDRSAIAPSRPDRDGGSVVSHLPLRNARTDDDDDLAQQVIVAVLDRTQVLITETRASEVIAEILGRASGPVRNPRRFVLASVAGEPDPRSFLPPQPARTSFASRPDWCGDPCCNRETRRREKPGTRDDDGPCPKCSTALSVVEAS